MDLVLPIVEDKESVNIELAQTEKENEVLLYVYAKSSDVARLIGRQGSMATSLRQMLSIGSFDLHKKISIKFEAIEE